MQQQIHSFFAVVMEFVIFKEAQILMTLKSVSDTTQVADWIEWMCSTFSVCVTDPKCQLCPQLSS